MGLAALMMIALALVWPQGLGARSPWPFGHPLAPRAPARPAQAGADGTPAMLGLTAAPPAKPAAPASSSGAPQ